MHTVLVVGNMGTATYLASNIDQHHMEVVCVCVDDSTPTACDYFHADLPFEALEVYEILSYDIPEMPEFPFIFKDTREAYIRENWPIPINPTEKRRRNHRQLFRKRSAARCMKEIVLFFWFIILNN